VDDFLTKPVNFNKLDGLMKARQGGAGTGFLDDRDKKKTPESDPMPSQLRE
jgi:hypothetical protein